MDISNCCTVLAVKTAIFLGNLGIDSYSLYQNKPSSVNFLMLLIFDISSLYHLIAFYLHKFHSFHDVQTETRASNKTSSPSLGSKFNLEALPLNIMALITLSLSFTLKYK